MGHTQPAGTGRVAGSSAQRTSRTRRSSLAAIGAARTLVPVEAPLGFEEAVELEHPIVLLEPLAFLLNRLLDQLCARLGSRALATQDLCLTLELESFSPRNRPAKINNQNIFR